MQPAPNSEIKDKIAFKEFLALTKWVLKLYYDAFPKQTIILITSHSLLELKPIINAYVFAKIIDVLIKASQTPGATLNAVVPYIFVLIGYNLIDTLVDALYWNVRATIESKARPIINDKFASQLKYLGIQTLEQPEINNKIYRAEKALGGLMNYLYQLVRVLANSIKLITSVAIMLTISPLLLLLVCIFLIPSYFIDKKYRRQIWRLNLDYTEPGRLANMNYNDISNSKSLLEIIINGSFKYFKDKYVDFSNWFSNREVSIMRKWNVTSYLTNIPNESVLALGLITIFKRLLDGLITVGDVTFQYQMISTLQQTLSSISQYINNLFEYSLRIRDTYDLFITKPVYADGTIEMPILTQGPKIEFRDLSFTYPGAEALVVNNVKLTIKSGEKIAIVGHNGAGKTTLVKLLCRVYKASEGQILINDINVNDLKVESFYKNVGVLMQEYNTHGQLTPRENIYVGDTSKELREVDIRLAAQSADATEFVEDYKNKFDQILTEKVKGGIRPSTGQWQKLAIARFFYRDAPLLIFDEPTAAIDAVSEYNIFNKIYEFFKGKTVIIISHRFSTVRNADRIIVMDHGQAVEEGTHSELIARNGFYAKAFLLQAEGYAKE